MSASFDNCRKFLEAAQALVRSSHPDIGHIKTTIETLAAVISDLSEVPVRLEIIILEN